MSVSPFKVGEPGHAAYHNLQNAHVPQSNRYLSTSIFGRETFLRLHICRFSDLARMLSKQPVFS
jgi:hypothetical protein